MTETFFGDLYKEAESGTVGGNVPASTYDVVVTGARALDTSSLIFLTLQVLNGPQQGKECDVNLYFPGEGDKRGARVFFMRKIKGFIAYPDVKAAFQAADGAPDRAAGFEHIANSLLGKRVQADIGLRTEGDYAGSNELSSTKPLGEVPATAPEVQASEPMQVAQPAPAEADSQASSAVPF